jgi:hypothetical protein
MTGRFTSITLPGEVSEDRSETTHLKVALVYVDETIESNTASRARYNHNRNGVTMSDLQRRSEALLRERGYLTASVERRKRFPQKGARPCKACGAVKMVDISADLWNYADLIALRHCNTRQNNPLDFVFVQVTSAANHAARRNKIIASSEARLCLLSGARILIQSWKKKDNRWAASDEWISLDQFVFGLPATVEQFYEDERRKKLLTRGTPGRAVIHEPISDELPF